MLTSLMEFISWFWWLAGDGRLFGWWAGGVGWWGAVVAMPVPVLFAVFQLAFDTKMGGFEGNYQQEVGEFTVWVIVMSAIVWLFAGLVHIIYSPRLLAQINPEVNKPCQCDYVTPLDPLSSNEEKVPTRPYRLPSATKNARHQSHSAHSRRAKTSHMKITSAPALLSKPRQLKSSPNDPLRLQQQL